MGNSFSAKSATMTEIAFNLRRVVLVADRRSRKKGREIGLTGPQMTSIRLISSSGPLKITALAEIMQIHRATASKIVDSLDEKGFISRKRSIIDRRSVEVDLTPQGKDMARKINENHSWTLESALHGVSDEKVRYLCELLEDLIQIIQS